MPSKPLNQLMIDNRIIMSLKNKIYKSLILALAIGTINPVAMAGNKDRIGSNGADHIKINPWARSGGFGNANSASVGGIEATFLNVAGLSDMGKMDLNFTHNAWLGGSNTGLSSFGYGQRLGEYSVVGAGFQTFSMGDITRTTTQNPEGNGTFSAQYGTFYLSYAREFSNAISAGVTVKSISEGISNAKASAMAFDFGIRYQAGAYNNIKFGIALKNIGGELRFQGDGLDTKTTLDEKEFTVKQRTQGVELPSILNIGVSYDYLIGEFEDFEETGIRAMHRITPALNFMSNSFGKDQISFGVEYAFKEFVMFRAAYLYEDKIADETLSTIAYTGPSGGLTVAIPVNKTGSSLDVDYSYRATKSFSGTHSIGVRFNY